MTAAAPQPPSLSLRTRLLSGGRGITFSDGVSALMFAVAAVVSFLWRDTPMKDPLLHLHDQLALGLAIDGGFALLSATLVDIATRVRVRPPLWAVILIAGTVFVFYGGYDVLQKAWALGGAVLIPVLFSLVDRAGVLWHLPTKTRIEKIAARALVSNRINAVLVVGFLFVTTVFGAMALHVSKPRWTEHGTSLRRVRSISASPHSTACASEAADSRSVRRCCSASIRSASSISSRCEVAPAAGRGRRARRTGLRPVSGGRPAPVAALSAS